MKPNINQYNTAAPAKSEIVASGTSWLPRLAMQKLGTLLRLYFDETMRHSLLSIHPRLLGPGALSRTTALLHLQGSFFSIHLLKSACCINAIVRPNQPKPRDLHDFL